MEDDTSNLRFVNDNIITIHGQSENPSKNISLESHDDHNSREHLLNSLIEAELDDSTTVVENVNDSVEMFITNNAETVPDNADQIDTNNSTDIHDIYAVETSRTEENVADGCEKNDRPDSAPNDDESIKPKDILSHFPLGRIKRIIKADPEVPVISAESLFLMSKATELFLRWLGKEIYAHTVQQKKKTIQIRDLNLAIAEHPALEFLDGALD